MFYAVANNTNISLHNKNTEEELYSQKKYCTCVQPKKISGMSALTAERLSSKAGSVKHMDNSARQEARGKQCSSALSADEAHGKQCLTDIGSRLLTHVSYCEVHTCLQAAALRLFPERELLLPDDSMLQCPIRTLQGDMLISIKFDLAQVWYMISPSSFVTPYGFRRALTGKDQDSPHPELDDAKYPSLELLRYSQDLQPGTSQNTQRMPRFKYRAYMNAQDMLIFLMSDFARKGQFDEIFASGVKSILHPVAILEHPERAYKVKQEDAASLPLSPRHVFRSSCLDRNCELHRHFERLRELEALADGPDLQRMKRRKLLANEAMQSITSVLFDANKLVLDTMLSEKK